MPISPRQPNIDWSEARTLYETTNIGIKALAVRYGVDPKSVRRHRDTDGWVRTGDESALPDPPARERSASKIVRFPHGARKLFGKDDKSLPIMRPFEIDENDENHVALASTAVALTRAMMKKVIGKTILSPEDLLSIEVGRDLVQTARNAVLLDREVKGLKQGDASVPVEKSNEVPGKRYVVAVEPAEGVLEQQAESA